MEAPYPPLWARLDSALTNGLQQVIKWLGGATLALTGGTAMVLTWQGLFEHGEGLMELSRLEWLFIALFLLLERRLFSHTGYRGYRWWAGLWRMLTGLGLYALLWITAFGFLAIPLVMSGAPWAPSNQAEMSMSGLVQPLWLIGMLMTLFLAIPTRPAPALPDNASPKIQCPPTAEEVTS